MAYPLVQQRMWARPCLDGVAFRVWAPHASQVSVVGAFNDWDASAHPMTSEPRGYWYAFVDSARIGDHYSYQLSTHWGVHVITTMDEDGGQECVRDAIVYRCNDDTFERVISSEFHDDVANGQARRPQHVNSGMPMLLEGTGVS